MEPFQVKMPCGSIKDTQTTLPLACPQVVQTRKHSAQVRIAERKTPYTFPLILALAWLTAVSVLEGQGGHSSHRGQASCCLVSEQPHEKGPLQNHGGFFHLHSWVTDTLPLLFSWKSTSEESKYHNSVCKFWKSK